jgi:hypothetical protein
MRLAGRLATIDCVEELVISTPVQMLPVVKADDPRDSATS